MTRICQVCIPHSHKDFYSYLAEDLDLQPGVRVRVPFRQGSKIGVVLAVVEAPMPDFAIKPIEAVLDETPLIEAPVFALCDWIAAYYQSPLSEVIPMALPKKYRLGQTSSLPMTDAWSLAVTPAVALASLSPRAKKQQALILFLSEQPGASPKQITNAGFTTQHCLSLAQQGLIQKQSTLDYPYPVRPVCDPPLALNAEQDQALTAILARLGQFHCFLLQGVTGSGKTEVYLQAINAVLEQKRQVLILVPEIGLTPQLVNRFLARLPVPLAVIHSQLNETERQQAWDLARQGLIRVLIGTRAAVLTPMPDLGLVIIDEEHDTSFKQMEGVRYSARDTALMRAHQAQIPIILGSATPSLESLHNVEQGKYTALRLQNRAAAANPVHYQILDIRNQPLQEGLALPCLQAIEQHLQNKNQVLIFINRRGFSPVLLCHQCGWMADCNACDSHLTVHKRKGVVVCHHCGLQQSIPHGCPKCHSRELIPVGLGTQRIHQFLIERFPKTQCARIDRDEVSGKEAFDKQLARILSGEIQLMVGTQMLAKGHHFPKLSLVVILDADAGFYNQDFRALEKLGQLLIQVAGRAGREKEAGQVIIQTHLPQHPLLNALVQSGYEAFARELLAMRQLAALPPYQYLALIRAQGSNPARVLQFLHAAKDKIILPKLHLLGPAPAPLAVKARQHRMQLLIKSPSRPLLKSALQDLRQWLDKNPLSNGIRWNVDVDPIDLS